jgi:multicomponent Na+:H+ antiporter subunit A
LTLYFLHAAGSVSTGATLDATYPWIPQFGIDLSFRLDGLSLLFSVIVSGIGCLIVLYSGDYLKGHPYLGRFYCCLFLFMGSMLGVILSNNIVTMFIFWELTSVSSYFLIGFDHERESARASAWQALLLTSAGGLALLAGLLLLASVGDSMQVSDLLAQGEAIREHALYLPILGLVALGAFTKSAQFPFHFWLPNAMEAPTPVSAYLHSSTMVNMGIYLLARLSPILGGTPEWRWLVTGIGGITICIGAFLAIRQCILKRLLAYSTISALGMMFLLLGMGGDMATRAAMGFLLAHALYKATLFLVAGSIDHATGERNVNGLGGLRSAMPITAAAAGLAAMSMAGLPPLLGFVGKEALYGATLHAPVLGWLLSATVTFGGMAFVVVGALVACKCFFGARVDTPTIPHEAPWGMTLGPVLLAGLGLAGGPACGLVDSWLVAPASWAILGQQTGDELMFWHGFDGAMCLSIATLLGGIVLYLARARLLCLMPSSKYFRFFSAAQWYEWILNGALAAGRGQTRILQHGYLRRYIRVTILVAIGLVGITFLGQHGWPRIANMPALRFDETGLALFLAMAVGATLISRSRFAAVASLGMVGYGVGLVYVFFGAPDLAITQFTVETLSVVLFMLAFYKLPSYSMQSSLPVKVRDIVIALAAGALMTGLVLATHTIQYSPSISSFFEEKSVLKAHGHNIVNVILVDFRGFDTLGEITVLGIAGLGAFALLKLRVRNEED